MKVVIPLSLNDLAMTTSPELQTTELTTVQGPMPPSDIVLVDDVRT